MWSSRECARRAAVDAVVCLAFGAVALVPSIADAEPTVSPASSPSLADVASAVPPPPQAAPSPEPSTAWNARKRLFASVGATAFVLPYLASAIAATTGYPNDDGDTSSRAVLWVPAVGPFIALGDGYDALASFFLVLDGVAQIGGLSLLVYGLVSPAAPHPDDDGAKHAQVTFAPTLVHGAPGGTFAVRF
jgi:hypothetical protein